MKKILYYIFLGVFLCVTLVLGAINLFASDVDLIITIPEPVVSPILPTLNFDSDKSEIELGEGVLLSWSSTGATVCFASTDWSGGKSTSGSENIFPETAGLKNFLLTCSGDGGSINKLVSLNVSLPAVPISEDVVIPPVLPIDPGSSYTEPTEKEVSVTKGDFRITISTNKNQIIPDGEDSADIVVNIKSILGTPMGGIPVSLFSDNENDILYPESTYTVSNGDAYFAVKSYQEHISTVFAKATIDEDPYDSGSITLVFKRPTIPLEEQTVIPGIEAIGQSITNFRNNETVKGIASKVLTPLVGAASLAGGSLILISLFKSINDLLPILNHLLTLILQFFGIGRRRKHWSVIYDSQTKEVLELAIARLFNDSGRMVKTAVTDKLGRFGFDLDPGRYKILVSKPFYNFPSKSLKGLKRDKEYTQLYFGEKFKITKSGLISFSIPLDPFGLKNTKRGFADFIKSFLDTLSLPMLVIGILLSLFILWINPGILNAVILGIYILLLILKKLFLTASPRPQGTVFDAKTKKPLGGLVVRVFTPKYNKMVAARVTNKDGGFALLLPTGLYYIRVASPGYVFANKQKISDKGYAGEIIDIKEGKDIKINIPLTKI